METKKKILIVDDESDILEFLSYNFRKKGYEVLIAENGRTGFEIARREKPDVIISDLLMPVMDGIEFCQKVRKDFMISETPFIMLSAVNDDYKVLYAMSSGADEYATKPIRFKYLLELVRQTITEKELI
jgi:two-component system alkaline phosphatase synthesis response regulator PhoP